MERPYQRAAEQEEEEEDLKERGTEHLACKKTSILNIKIKSDFSYLLQVAGWVAWCPAGAQVVWGSLVELGVSEGAADPEEGRLLQEEEVAGKEVCWEG